MTGTFGRLVALAGPTRGRLALAVALGAVTALAGVGLMATAGYLISRAAEQPAILSLTVAIVMVRFFGLLRPLARYGERLASHDVALRSLGRVRARFYARIEPLAPAQLEGYAHGDLLSRMVADVDALQNLHLRGLAPALVALVAGAVSAGVAAAVLPAAGLVLAAGLVVAGVAVPAMAAAMGRRAARRQAALRGELSTELVETLRAAPELVAYGRAEDAEARVAAADRALVGLSRRDARVAGLADGLVLVVMGVTVAAVLALAVQAHAAGELDRVLVAMLGLLALASFDALAPLSAAARELPVTLGAGRRVLELMDRRPAVSDPPDPVRAPAWPFAVELDGVHARYGAERRPVLRGVGLRLEPGARIALVGPSGAGKTTVVNLLLRFLDPLEGRVTLGGRDLRELRLEDVRRAIAVAGQDGHLFSATIRDNVRLGRPEATDDEIEQVLRRAGAWPWIAGLPAGLATPVGEVGRAVSGGQRQRLVIARALLADAPVLVLDEPTAHLDPPAAQQLMEDVLRAPGDRTVLLITHRTEGLGLVDAVLALDHGRIVAVRHAEPTARVA